MAAWIRWCFKRIVWIPIPSASRFFIEIACQGRDLQKEIHGMFPMLPFSKVTPLHSEGLLLRKRCRGLHRFCWVVLSICQAWPTIIKELHVDRINAAPDRLVKMHWKLLCGWFISVPRLPETIIPHKRQFITSGEIQPRFSGLKELKWFNAGRIFQMLLHVINVWQNSSGVSG